MKYHRHSGVNRKLLNVKVVSRKVKEQKKEKAGKWLMLVLILSVSLTGTVVATKFIARKMFYENESYTIKHIQIDNLAQMNEAAIVKVAGVAPGDNLFALDMEGVRAKLEAIPHIKHAEVSRQLPDTLIIKLIERQPVARLGIWSGRVENGVRVIDQYLLDDESVVLGKKMISAPQYPFIVGIPKELKIEEGRALGIEEALAACKLLKRLETSPARSIAEVSQVDVSKRDQVTLILNDGARIKFLNGFVDEHIERLEVILNYTYQNEKILQTADLTVDRNVPVVFQP